MSELYNAQMGWCLDCTLLYYKEEGGDLQDGGGLRRGDHLLCTNTSEIHLHVEQLLQNTY